MKKSVEETLLLRENKRGKIIPWSIRKCDYHEIGNYVNSLEVKEAHGKYVPDSTFFCLDIERNIFVGGSKYKTLSK